MKHRFSDHVMANISHVCFFLCFFCFLFFIFCVSVFKDKHNKLKQESCQNDDRLRRIGGS